MTTTLYLPRWLTYAPPGRLEFVDAAGVSHCVAMHTLALLEANLSTCIQAAADALMTADYGARWVGVDEAHALAGLLSVPVPKAALALLGIHVALLHSQRFPVVIPEGLP
jgi:hypothetical protein